MVVGRIGAARPKGGCLVLCHFRKLGVFGFNTNHDSSLPSLQLHLPLSWLILRCALPSNRVHKLARGRCLMRWLLIRCDVRGVDPLLGLLPFDFECRQWAHLVVQATLDWWVLTGCHSLVPIHCIVHVQLQISLHLVAWALLLLLVASDLVR